MQAFITTLENESANGLALLRVETSIQFPIVGADIQMSAPFLIMIESAG